MNKQVILAAGTPQVLLPYENASRFTKKLKAYRGPLASWTAWQVPRTMKLADAAKHVGMAEHELREINRIPPRMRVKAGSTLLVHRSDRHDHDVSERVADSAMIALAPDGPSTKRRVVRARAKDSVKSIARRYGVPASQVAQWNKVGTGASFAKGHRVVLYLPVSKRNLAAESGKVRKVAKSSRSAKSSTKMARKSGKQSKVRVASAR